MCSAPVKGGTGLGGVIRGAVRRYDVLVKLHAEMYLKGSDEKKKRMLTGIFVEKTFDDLAAICNDPELRETVSKYLCAYTDRVINECHGNRSISTEALPRVGFYYLYALYLLPDRWFAELKKLEPTCYRDLTSVYDRYIAVKTTMAKVFDTISNYILRLLFGKGDRNE